MDLVLQSTQLWWDWSESSWVMTTKESTHYAKSVNEVSTTNTWAKKSTEVAQFSFFFPPTPKNSSILLFSACIYRRVCVCVCVREREREGEGRCHHLLFMFSPFIDLNTLATNHSKKIPEIQAVLELDKREMDIKSIFESKNSTISYILC